MPTKTTGGPSPQPLAAETLGDRVLRLAQGHGADALLARYLDNHGRVVIHTHRGNGMTREVRLIDFCPCPICTDTRAHLKLED